MKLPVVLVYDGDCPLCNMASSAVRIKKSAGKLELVNARDEPDHPLMQKISANRLDLDEGMVLSYHDQIYHGKDALLMMALLGSEQGWFNRLNALLFRSKTMVRFAYPILKGSRNLLLRLLGVPKIQNLKAMPQEPLAKQILSEQWDSLPAVMKNHYAIRGKSSDRVRAEGHLDIQISPMVRLLARLTGMLVPYEGKKVPVTVTFFSDPQGAFHLERVFYFEGNRITRFHSKMIKTNKDELTELMGFGLGWSFKFSWNSQNISLDHQRYVLNIGRMFIPVPLSILLGKGYAEEYPTGPDRFSMWTHAKHPLLGVTFGYKGEFQIVDVSCAPS